MPICFDDIISLGSDCEVALQLRRLGLLHTPSVFDWLITPWDAMLRVIQDEGTHLCNNIYSGYNGTGAVCSGYELVYWHEFPRDEAGQVMVTQAAANTAQKKLRHKIDRMQAVLKSGKTVLFVRGGMATDAPRDKYGLGLSFPTSRLNDFPALISRLFPELKFSLLFLEYVGRDRLEGDCVLDPRIMHYRMECPKNSNQPICPKPDPAAWELLFSRVNYDHKPNEHASDNETLF